jgi:hypothetical protein
MAQAQGVEAIHCPHHVSGVEGMNQVGGDAIRLLSRVHLSSFIPLMLSEEHTPDRIDQGMRQDQIQGPQGDRNGRDANRLLAYGFPRTL